MSVRAISLVGAGLDLGGHAAKAKDLLDDANEELKLAAEAANRR